MAVPNCVADYDELAGLDPTSFGPSPPCYVFVKGFPLATNGGIQGFFQWRPDSFDNDDGGTVIRPTKISILGAGRWHRVYDGAISAKWFGGKAVPNCVADYDELATHDPKQLGPSPPCYVFVSGSPLEINGGIQGYFQWRPDSLDNADGGTVIRPNAVPPLLPGRWHRVYDGPISVKWFGAKGDCCKDDRAAIQACINAAAAAPVGCCAESVGSVAFPPGRYRITHALRPEFDNLTLLGSAGAVLVSDPPDDEPFAEAILVDKNFPDPPTAVNRLVIRDLTIEVKNGANGSVSMGVIQLNNCIDCLVSDILVRYVGPTSKPKNIDGIVTSQGTTGLIQGCTVDGIPKAGIYIAGGSHDVRVEACESRNISGPIGRAGIQVSGDRITIHNCLAHHNAGPGLLISVTGSYDLLLMSWGDGTKVPASGKDLVVVGIDNNSLLHIRIFDASGSIIADTDETKLTGQAAAIQTLKQQLPGLVLPHVLTDAEKNKVIDEAISIVSQVLTGSPFSVPTNIQVSGGLYHDNGEDGIRIASEWYSAHPQHIQLMGVTAENNNWRGISVEAGWDVLMTNPASIANGIEGIWLENLPVILPQVPRTTRVMIAAADVYDNGVGVGVVASSGIGLRAVDQVTIQSGRFAKTGGQPTSRQEFGVGLYVDGQGQPCSQLRVLDPDASSSQKQPVAALDPNGYEDAAAAAASGYFRLQSSGNPEGAVAAPPGSEYVDLSTGFAYRKSTGVGATGWIQF
jgi:hypothetical protein